MVRMRSTPFCLGLRLTLLVVALYTSAVVIGQSTSTPQATAPSDRNASPATTSQGKFQVKKVPCRGDFGAFVDFFDVYGDRYDDNQLDLAKGIQPKYPTETWAEKSSHGSAGLREEEWEAVFAIVIDIHKQILQERQTYDEYHAKYLQDRDAEAHQGMQDSLNRETALYKAGIQRIHDEIGDEQFARLSHDIDLNYLADDCTVTVPRTSPAPPQQ